MRIGVMRKKSKYSMKNFDLKLDHGFHHAVGIVIYKVKSLLGFIETKAMCYHLVGIKYLIFHHFQSWL